MQQGRAARYLTAVGFLVVIGLLVFAVVQLDALEERLAIQGQQIRALGEATDRLFAHGPRTAAASVPSSEAVPDEAPAHVLHPEAPNFLKPKELH